MNNPVQISLSDEKIRYLLKKEYVKHNQFLIDDLFILSLKNVQESNIEYLLYVEEDIISDEAKKVLSYYLEHVDCYKISRKIANRLQDKGTSIAMFLLTSKKEEEVKLNSDSLILVCDGLELSGNIGTIFRTSASLNADLIIFCNEKAKINSNNTLKASRGMLFNVNYKIIKNCSETYNFLKSIGSRIVVCEPEQGIDFKKFDYSNSLAIIVGNERYGVDHSWFDYKDVEFIKIPMYGEITSLNVSVAASLVLYEAKYYKFK